MVVQFGTEKRENYMEDNSTYQSRNEYKFYLKISLLIKGSPKICPQTGLSVFDIANASPQVFSEDVSIASALLNVSYSQI